MHLYSTSYCTVPRLDLLYARRLTEVSQRSSLTLDVLSIFNMRTSLICPITAVRFAQLYVDGTSLPRRYIFAGCGPELRVYRVGDDLPILRKRVLPNGTRIHGISVRGDGHVALHGGRYLAQCSFSFLPQPEVRIIARREFDDWVFKAIWLRKLDRMCVALGHGRATVCSTSDLASCASFQCSEKEISWSATLFVAEDGVAIDVLHGTSFGDILFWSFCDEGNGKGNLEERSTAPEVVEKDAQRLKGHNGPVMRLRFSENGEFLASASVDRSVRVWKRESLTESEIATQAANAAASTFVPFRVHFGHLARVWDVQFTGNVDAGVVSVGEDRACRVWSPDQDSCEIHCFQGHDGRNVWCVDVLHCGGEQVVVTGGEDGVLKIRALLCGAAADEGAPVGHASVSRAGELHGFALPDDYKNPRKVDGGGTNESARTILACDARGVVLATDFGRILHGEIAIRGDGDEEDGIAWTVLYCDERGTAFVPNALAISEGLLFAGQTDGHVIVLEMQTKHRDDRGRQEIWRFPGTGQNARMVMGIFAIADRELGVVHVFVVSPHGEVLHWMLQRKAQGLVDGNPAPFTREKIYARSRYRSEWTSMGVTNCENGARLEAADGSRLLAVYRHKVVKKNMLGTCVAYLPCCEIVLVGDRGGRVSAYSAKANDVQDGKEEEAVTQWPFCICRPHSDRVTALKVVAGVADEGDKCLGVHEILTSSFDGRLSRLSFRKPDASLEVLSTQRSIERVETICKVFFPRDSESQSSLVYNRQCVVGFRSTDIVMWDIQQRNEVFRWDCGNWRRAFDLKLEVSTRDRNGPLLIDRLFFVFWRAGRLFVVERGELDDGAKQESKGSSVVAKRETESHMQSLGPAFHGQRVNDIELIPSVTDTEKTRYVMTAGEDTILRVMRIDEMGLWHTEQVLTQHISGVYGVAVTEISGKRLVAVSGGGCDEVIVWAARQESGPWVKVSSISGSAGIISGAERRKDWDSRSCRGDAPHHRVLSVACLPVSHCCCLQDCVMAVIGRSDGTVSLLRCCASGSKEGRPVAKSSLVSQFVGREKENKGAVMSLAVTASGRKYTAMSGDSGGFLCIWDIDGDVLCHSRTLRLRHRWRAHDGGVLSISAVSNGDVVVGATGGDCGYLGVLEVDKGNVTSEKQLVSAGAVSGVCIVKSELGTMIVGTGAAQVLFACGLCRGRNGEVRIGEVRTLGMSEVVDSSAMVAYWDQNGRSHLVVSGRGMEDIEIA